MADLKMGYPSSPPESGQPRHARQDSQQATIAVPYYPQLKRLLRSVNAALVVAYLEMHYPSPPPDPPRRYGLPVTIDFGHLADALAVDRRTLGLTLIWVSNWYETEIQRVGAVRAGQEFLNRRHNRAPRLKLYSVVGTKGWRSLSTITLRRNWPRIQALMAECNIDWNARPSRPEMTGAGEKLIPLQGLTEILMRGVELAQDRRRTRYSRLRSAKAPAPERGAVSGKLISPGDPELDAIAARLAGRRGRKHEEDEAETDT